MKRYWIIAVLFTAFGCGAQVPSATSEFANRDDVGKRWQINSPPGPVAFIDGTRSGGRDFIVIAGRGQPLRVLQSTERGVFERPGEFVGGTLHWPAELAVTDYNGDGHLDVFVADHETRLVHIYLGSSAGALSEAPHTPLAVPSDPHLHTLDVGDINGDSYPDLLTDSWADDRVYVHKGHPNGFTVAEDGLMVGSQPRNNVRLADVNADGALDILSPATRQGGVSVLLGNGHGHFTAAPESPISTAESPFFVATADFDADGRREILVAHRGSSWADDRYDALSLVRLDSDGQLRRDDAFNVQSGRSPSVIAICNVDGGNGDDAVVANSAGKTLTVLRGGPNAFTAYTTAPLAGHPVALACADATNNEAAFAVVSSQNPDQIVVVSLRE